MRAITTIAVALVAAASFIMPVAGSEPEQATQPGTLARLVRDIDVSAGSEPRELTRVGGLVYFTADDGVRGRELWVSDGTEAGTRLVRDIRPGEIGSSPARLARVDGSLYLSANDGTHGRELWVSDGTAAGTKLVRDITTGPKGTTIDAIADGAGSVYFTRAHRELWRSDGTARGTVLLREFHGVDVDGAPTLAERLVFSADDALWETNGTAAGTKRLSPVFWGLDGLTRFRGHVYFRAAPPLGAFGGVPELWWTDGTRVGTRRLGTALNPTDATVMDGDLYFNAQRSATKAPRLYRSDGTVVGTAPVSPRVRPLWGMTRETGRLWATDASPGQFEPDELWVSDGTAGGTSRVHGGTGDWYIYDWEGRGHVSLDGRLWFAASPLGTVDGEVDVTDSEVWSSDGTMTGTLQATDINAVGSSFPREFVKLGQAILFSADDGIHGREVWSLTQP